MARDYLATFARLRQYQDGSKVTPELPRATRRRRAGANVAAA
jgi:hypothetical protein